VEPKKGEQGTGNFTDLGLTWGCRRVKWVPTEGVGANRVMWKRHREKLSTRTEKNTDLGLQASQVGAGKGRRRQQQRHVARGLE